MTRYALIPAVLLAAGCATTEHPAPEGGERWECGDYGGCFDCPVTLTADIRNGTGTVHIDGIDDQRTAFRIRGIERVWLWSLDFTDDTYDYVFVIDSNGGGRYYDFAARGELGSDGKVRAKPSEVFKCWK